MSYSEKKHRHNFAIWAGARAAQRGFTKVEILREALEQCGVTEYVDNFPTNQSQDDFDKSHNGWCLSICDHLKEKGIQNVTYGRAAKLIAVYLKSIIVLPHLSSDHVAYIHPPIDRILLQNLSGKRGLEVKIKEILKNTNWTELDEIKYLDLVKILRDIINPKPFWMLEEFWTVTND